MSSESVKNSISLMLITIIAGLLLGVVYEITKEPIAKEQQRAKQEAYKVVFETADSFEVLEIDVEKTKKQLKKQGFDVTINEVMQALNASGDVIGHVMTVIDHEGYGGDIEFAIGLQSDGTVNGISFLSISETAGLGMKAAENDFMKQFSNKKVEEFRYTKNGASSDEEVDALSGATITTNAVVNGVNAAIYYSKKLK